MTSFVVWDHSRGALSDLACSQGECPPHFFLYLAPGSATPEDTKGWVLVSGHRNDPASEACHYVYPPDWTQSPFPEFDARALCRSAFVLTSIKRTTAP